MPIFRTMPPILGSVCVPFVAERLQFIRNWCRAPRTVGAILPSGSALARAIVLGVNACDAPVLELGSGTGSFTRPLLKRGIPSHQLHLVELNHDFACRLRHAFPGTKVYECDARRMVLPEGVRGHIGATISGLPLLNMSANARMRLLCRVFSQMRPGGALYLFSYGWFCPVSQRLLDRLGLRAACTATVMWNVPPARVWKITRRAPYRHS